MASNATISTPRQFLTTLLKSLPTPTPGRGTETSNPLKFLDPKDHFLLTTLHVIFPTPILLPALDLLDRQLVTRVIQVVPSTRQEPIAGEIHPAQGHSHLLPEPEQLAEAQNDFKKANYFYVVTSASDGRGRGGGSGGRSSYGGADHGQGQTYIVRTSAWNCSCAAFTFSAFPASLSGFSVSSEADAFDFDGGGGKMDVYTEAEGKEDKEGGWEFGGVSSDGKDSGAVPCCKHLLACVLVERWKGVLGRYVVEKIVRRDEMAGMGAGVE